MKLIVVCFNLQYSEIFGLQMVTKCGLSFSSTTKFRLKLKFCVTTPHFYIVLVWRWFSVPLFPIRVPLFPIHVPLVPLRVPAFPIRVPSFPTRVLSFSTRVLSFPIRVLSFSIRVPSFPTRILSFPIRGNQMIQTCVQLPSFVRKHEIV